MGLKASRPRSLPQKILSRKDLQQVAQSDSPFIQIETREKLVFLDTSLQQILYGDPIGADSPSSNLSTVWTVTEASQGYIISNVTTPIGQVQPSSYQTGEGTHVMNVLPVSTNQDFVWTADVSDGKWALSYIEQPGARPLYALPVPVNSDNPGLTPPRDNLIQAVDVTTQDVNVYVFTRCSVDSIKYKSDMPPGIDVFLRPPPQRTT